MNKWVWTDESIHKCGPHDTYTFEKYVYVCIYIEKLPYFHSTSNKQDNIVKNSSTSDKKLQVGLFTSDCKMEEIVFEKNHLLPSEMHLRCPSSDDIDMMEFVTLGCEREKLLDKGSGFFARMDSIELHALLAFDGGSNFKDNLTKSNILFKLSA